MTIWALAVALLLGFCGVLAANRVHRHEAHISNSASKSHWCIYLPGHEEAVYPAHVVPLKDWVGTRYKELKGVDKDTGEENAEATAGLALVMMGLYPGYQLTKEGDHCVLRRPEKRERYFTNQAHYKIPLTK